MARAWLANQDDEYEVATIESGEDTCVNTELQPRERRALEQLLEKYEHIFASHQKRPGRCRLNESHIIETGGAAPQKSRPGRIPIHWESEISRQLEEMLSSDPPICRSSKSPWSSDVIFVRKRDGTLRFAVDYRRLNAVTKRDEYSLPNSQAIFDRQAAATSPHRQDIASAYWSIPIQPEDIEKTAFHTPRGLYEMKCHAVWSVQCTGYVPKSDGSGTGCHFQLPKLRGRYIDLFPDL